MALLKYEKYSRSSRYSIYSTVAECMCKAKDYQHFIFSASGIFCWFPSPVPDPPPKRKGGSGGYSTSSHHGVAVLLWILLKLEVTCWASVNWKCAKWLCKDVKLSGL